MPTKGYTPWKLTATDIDELRKAGILDRINKNLPGSPLAEATNEFLEEAGKRSARKLILTEGKRLALLIVRALPVIAIAISAGIEYREGGVEAVIKNAVVPGGLVEEVAKASAEKIVEKIAEKQAQIRERARAQVDMEKESPRVQEDLRKLFETLRD